MSFSARFMRFLYTKTLTFWDEKLAYGLTLKHMLYLMFAVAVAWSSLTRGFLGGLFIGIGIVFLSFVSSIYGKRAMSFEGKFLSYLFAVAESIGSRNANKKAEKKGK